MFTLRRSTFAAGTLAVLERLSWNPGEQMLTGRGTSSRDEKANEPSTSQMRPMQALVSTALKQENQKD